MSTTSAVGSVESYSLNSGNTAPRGAASTIAGDKTWVVDANRKVYVYDTSGGLLGSWTAGTLASNATVEGIATNGNDIWIVDAKSDKVYQVHGGRDAPLGQSECGQQFQPEQRQHQSQRHRDRRHVALGCQRQHDRQGVQVHGRGIARRKLDDHLRRRESDRHHDRSQPTSAISGSSTAAPSDVYQYNAAASRTSGSQAAAATFALAAGNTNPQGIADPPSVVAQQSGQLALTPSPTQIASATDAVLQGMARTPKIDGALFRTGARRVEANSGTSAKGRFLAVDTHRHRQRCNHRLPQLLSIEAASPVPQLHTGNRSTTRCSPPGTRKAPTWWS